MNPAFRRAAAVTLALLFVGCFIYCYEKYLSPVWGYYGFTQTTAPDLSLLLTAIAVAVLPALLLPTRATRASVVLTWMLYANVYVPSTLIPVLRGVNDVSRLYEVLFAFTVAFALIAWQYRIGLLQVPRVQMTPSAFKVTILVVGMIAILLLVFDARESMRLVAFTEVYVKRAATTSTALMNYVILFVCGYLLPVVLVVGLLRKKRWWVVAAVAGFVALYAISSLKCVILIVPVIVVVAVFERIIRRHVAVLVIAGAIASTALAFIGDCLVPGNLASTLVLMRVFGLAGLTTDQYLQFFDTEPLTYFSHLNVLQSFMSYPYSRPIYFELGMAFYGNPDLSQNTHTFAQDGLTALGIPGVAFMGLVLAVVLYFVDSVAGTTKVQFGVAALMSQVVNLTNGSLFTALLSGGFGLVILTLWVLPAEYCDRDRNRKSIRPSLLDSPGYLSLQSFSDAGRRRLRQPTSS
jgi:hypothetical protein